MTRRNKQIFVVLALIALLAFAALPIYNKYRTMRAVSASLQQRTQSAVEKNAQLQPDWDRAMADSVLTFAEAKEILEKAGEKVEAEE